MSPADGLSGLSGGDGGLGNSWRSSAQCFLRCSSLVNDFPDSVSFTGYVYSPKYLAE